MEKGDWPTVEFVDQFNTITSISELPENEVFVMVDFKIHFSHQKKALGVATVMDRNLKERRVWSVSMIDTMVANHKLPRFLVYKGLKSTKTSGKKMHLVNFSPITDKFKWIKEYCTKRNQVSLLLANISLHANAA